MGLMYTVSAEVTGVTTANDLIVLTAPSDAAVVIHSVRVSQVASATSEQGAVQMARATTAGSGGASATPRPLSAGGPASGSTAVGGNTTPAGTLTQLDRMGFNVLGGFERVFSPQERPEVSPSGIFVVRSDEDLATSVDLNVAVTFEEVGG